MYVYIYALLLVIVIKIVIVDNQVSKINKTKVQSMNSKEMKLFFIQLEDFIFVLLVVVYWFFTRKLISANSRYYKISRIKFLFSLITHSLITNSTTTFILLKSTKKKKICMREKI
jgi:hypothetical protein